MSIDDFEVLREQMNDFAARVEQHLGAKRATLISDTQNHSIQLNELKSQEGKLKNEIEEHRSREEYLRSSVKQSLESLQMQHLKVDELKQKQEQLLDQKNTLEQEIEKLSETTKSIERELRNSEGQLANQLERDYPELMKFEQYLGLRIEVVDIDVIKFIFVNIDPNDTTREFMVQLHIRDSDFKITETNPVLSDSTIHALEHDFTVHKEFVKFLKAVRVEFKKLV